MMLILVQNRSGGFSLLWGRGIDGCENAIDNVIAVRGANTSIL